MDYSTSHITVAAPYYSTGVIKRILTVAKKDVEKRFLLDVTEINMAAGTQSGLGLIKRDSKAEVRPLPNLHAKILIADAKIAIVTSANLTWTALNRNIEYGVKIDDASLVAQLLESVNHYWEQCEPLDFDALPLPRKKRREQIRPKRGKIFGHPVSPPGVATPSEGGWIIVHTEFSTASALREGLEETWQGDRKWHWTKIGRNPLREGGQHVVLLECDSDGQIVADGVVNTVRERYVDPETNKEYSFAFVFDKLNFPTSKVLLKDLPVGRRLKHHRQLIVLDDKILQTYVGMGYRPEQAPPYLPLIEGSNVKFPASIKRWWKLAPGRDANEWDEWFLHDFVSIGWNAVGDLDRLGGDVPRLRRAVVKAAKKARWPLESNAKELLWNHPRAVDHAVRTLSTFAGWDCWGDDSLKEGDGVVAYNETTVFALCRVEGAYEFRDDLSNPDPNQEPFLQTRQVNWLRILPNALSYPRAPDRIIRALGKEMRPTLVRIRDESVVREAWNLPQWKSL